MCGRYVQTAKRQAILGEFNVTENLANLPEVVPNYNVAPTQQVLVVREYDGERRLDYIQWKLIPFWAKQKKIKFSTFNARSEGLTEKATYRKPFKDSRCLIVNTGFIEFKKVKSGKDPYFIFPTDREVAGFAGLWDTWEDKETGEILDSCTIITTDANEVVKPIHPERMPVYLIKEYYDEWLDPENHDTASLQELLKPYPDELMEAYRIDRAINSVKNNSADLLSKK